MASKRDRQDDGLTERVARLERQSESRSGDRDLTRVMILIMVAGIIADVLLAHSQVASSIRTGDALDARELAALIVAQWGSTQSSAVSRLTRFFI